MEPDSTATDLTVRRMTMASGEFTPNGLVEPEALPYRVGGESIVLSVTLAQLLNARGLGSVGSCLTFLDRKPVWAYTSVGFVPKVKSGKLVEAEGDGVLIGVEGAAVLETWPSPINREEGTYRTFWLPADGNLPTWRQLGPYFPKTDWKKEASELAERLFSSHRDNLSAHWISLMGS